MKITKKFLIIIDESNIEVIGSPNTMSILTELLIPSVQQNEGDKVTEECCEQPQDESVTTVAAEKPTCTSSTVTTATPCMVSSMSKKKEISVIVRGLDLKM